MTAAAMSGVTMIAATPLPPLVATFRLPANAEFGTTIGPLAISRRR